MSDKAYHAKWHQENRERRMPLIKERRQKHKTEIREWLKTLKESNPCSDCGVSYPYYVMQFDHIGTDKTINIANVCSRGWSKSRIQSEIDKCELVCANCHCFRTFNRKMES